MADAKYVKKILKSEKDRQATLKNLSSEKQKRLKIAAAKQMASNLKCTESQHGGIQVGPNQSNLKSSFKKDEHQHANNVQVFKITSEKDDMICQ